MNTLGDMAWERVDLSAADADLPVAVGGSVAPHRLLEAQRHGAFPLPCSGGHAVEVNRTLYGGHVADGRITMFPPDQGAEPYALTWWCPPRRAVVAAAQVRLPHKLRQDLRVKHQWITSCDHAFGEVIDQCRDSRGTRRITDELRESLMELHHAGWAHSIEVWSGDDLIGGLFGTGMGGVFCAESIFQHRPDAGQVAIADLGRRLNTRPDALIDVQMPNGFMTELGAKPISRDEYLGALADIDLPLAPETGVLPVGPLSGGWQG
jgi:leucyl/phenylalanyl-tRNA---protein transferase